MRLLLVDLANFPVQTLGQVSQGAPLVELPDDKMLIVARGAEKEDQVSAARRFLAEGAAA
jgi:hypothetical protein